jgi:hypothetical protein
MDTEGLLSRHELHRGRLKGVEHAFFCYA